MEEFECSKFKDICQQDLWDIFEPAFSKAISDSKSQGIPLFEDIGKGSARSFIWRNLVGIFYEKFNELEEENKRLKSRECDCAKCMDLMKELNIMSSRVNNLSTHCAYLFSRLSSEIQKELGNDWSPPVSPAPYKIKKDKSDELYGNVNNPPNNCDLTTHIVLLDKLPETPTRTPLTPIKYNSPSLISPIKDEEVLKKPNAVLHLQHINFDDDDQENLFHLSKGNELSPKLKQRIGKSKDLIKGKKPNSTTSPKNSINGKGNPIPRSSGSNSTDNLPVGGNKTLLDITLHTDDEDIFLPTPPRSSTDKASWIKPLTPKASSGNGKPKLRNSDKKKMKQQTLLSMSKSFPKQTVDISTLKEFRGGSRPTQTTSENLYPTKRKSDEMNSESPNREAEIKDKIPSIPSDLDDLDTTVFEPPTLEMDIASAYEPVVLNYKTAPVGDTVQVQSSGPAPVVNPQPQLIPPTTYVKPNASKFKFKTGRRTKDFNLTEDLIKDFDKIPERVAVDDFGKPVRKKEERAKLPGWTCDQCRKYYEGLESQMHPSELQRIKDSCSRHRCNRPLDLNETPVDYWVTKLPSTEDAYRLGYIKVGEASPPVPKRRHDMLDDTDQS